MSLYKDLSRPLTPTLRALISVSKMSESDPVCLKDTDEFKRYYSEECNKLEIISANITANRRTEVETLFSRAEAHPIFINAKDSISTLLEWGNHDFDNISKYFAWFSNVWTVKNWKELCGDFDELRRALLTLGLKEYPLRSGTLCCEAKDWFSLISSNREVIKELLEKLNNENNPSSLSDIIKHYVEDEKTDITSPLYPLICDKTLMKFCEQKNVSVSKHTAEILSKVYRSADYKIVCNGVVYNTKIGPKDHLRKWTDTILFVDFDHCNLTVDFEYEEAGTYNIIVWPGKNPKWKSFDKLDELAIKFPQMKPSEKSDGALSMSVNDSHQIAHDTLYDVLNWIESNR